VVGLIQHALRSDAVRGPLNVVAPTPRQMIDFPRVLGHLLHRPSLVPAPKFALRMAFGEVADALLLASQRVLPSQASSTGYAFRYASLEEAFQAILDTRSDG
jgi:NAD dependent epimerase/dehydratase family enzyme